MKRILFLILIFLTACSAAQPTPISYFATSTTLPITTPQPGAAILTATATSKPVETESASPSEREAGELYFFLQPRQSGQSIQLAKVSGVCVFDSAKCPPLQAVQVPFAFNFTINALSWSPDGKYAAFSYSDKPNGTPTKLWLFDAAASTWTSLAEFAYIDPPFWSPDGKWIAFLVRNEFGAEDAYVIHPDGSGLKKVGVDLPADARPYIMDGWYADKVMMRSALNVNQAYLVNVDDGHAHSMFDSLPIKNVFVAAPDASLLAYEETENNNPAHGLKVMKPDGTGSTTLGSFAGKGRLYPIVWSHDSQRIAFAHYEDVNTGNPGAEVYVVNRDGSNLTLVYKGITIGHLIFSPDEKYLLVEEITSITGGHLFLVDLATLKTKILQAPGLSTDYDWYAPSWRP